MRKKLPVVQVHGPVDRDEQRNRFFAMRSSSLSRGLPSVAVNHRGRLSSGASYVR